VLSASSGTLIKGITPSYSFSFTGLPYRSLLMNSQDRIIFSGKQIASFEVSSTSFIWSFENTNIKTIGVLFGNPDTSYAAYFSAISSNCYLSLLHLSDGSIFYQHSFSLNNPSAGYLAERILKG
jgi:hypothetical protein